MSKILFSSIVTLITILLTTGLIIFLSMIYSNTYNVSFLIFSIIFFNLVSWLLSPMLMDIINYFLFKQTPLDLKDLQKNYPHIYEVINQISKDYNFNFPKFFIIDDLNPTAFTYGLGRFNARIVVSKGLFKYLNNNETKAVIGHELGHIVNRDFTLMIIATTLLEIFYIIYDIFTKKNSKTDPLIFIGYLSYFFYISGTYLILQLSRTREYLADNFSATITSAEDLANALIKISQGIITEEYEGNSQILLGATRALGIVDMEFTKQVGVASLISKGDSKTITEIIAYDIINPWSAINELSSTHPLIGKRIQALQSLSVNSKKKFSLDLQSNIKKLKIDYEKIYANFNFELFIMFIPLIFFILGFALSLILKTNVLGLTLILTGIGSAIKTRFKFSNVNFQKNNILDCMKNMYASPMNGIPIIFNGKIINHIYEDKSGIIYLDFVSKLPFISNLFFPLNNAINFLNKNSEVNGWYFRRNFSQLSLNCIKLKEGKDVINSYPVLYQYIWALIIIILGLFLLLS